MAYDHYRYEVVIGDQVIRYSGAYNEAQIMAETHNKAFGRNVATVRERGDHQHERCVDGPRIPLQYGGTVPTEVCKCGAWRLARHALPGLWRPAATFTTRLWLRDD
jgi:hypothetical protein